MKTRLVAVPIVVVAAALPSCDRVAVAPGGVQPPPPVTAGKPATRERAPGPFCSIGGHRELKLQAGTQLKIWDLKASGLKGFAARLLIIKDGEVEPAYQVEYEWPKWDRSRPAATGQLLFLFQDGEPFGAKGKRLPQMTVDFQDLPSSSRTERRSIRLLEGELQSRLALATTGASLGPDSVLYVELFVPPTDTDSSMSLNSNLESAIAVSKNGRTVVVIDLKWTPQE